MSTYRFEGIESELIPEAFPNLLSVDLKSLSSEQLNIYRYQAETISKSWKKEALKINTRDTTIYLNADSTQDMARTIQHDGLVLPASIDRDKTLSITGKSTAQKDALDFLGGISKGSTESEHQIARKIDDQDEGIKYPGAQLPGPVNSTENLVNANIGFNDTERDRWNDKIDNLMGSPNNDIGKFLKDCLPCGLRDLGPLTFKMPFSYDSLNKIIGRMEDLFNSLKGLSAETEGLEDFCRLMTLADFTCLPDLFSLISLLTLLQTKYLTELDLGLDGLVSSLIGAILGPMLVNITSTLEQYIGAIVDPLKCVVTALENQLAKIDLEAAGNRSRQIREQYERKRYDFLTSKIQSLKKRRAILEEERRLYPNDKYPRPRVGHQTGTLGDVYRDAKSVLGQRTDKRLSLNDSIKYASDNRSSEEYDRRAKALGDTYNNAKILRQEAIKQTTRAEEIKELDKDITSIERERKSSPYYKPAQYVNNKIDELSQSAAARAVGDAKSKVLNGAEMLTKTSTFLKTGLSDIINSVYEGIDVVNTSIEIMLDELKRTVSERVETQEDQIQLAKTLSKIGRTIGFCKAIGKLMKSGGLDELKKQCNDTMGAANFVSAYKAINPQDGFATYQATDINGDSLIVVTPANTKLTTTGFEDFSDPQDPLGQSGLLTEKTSEYNTNNEVHELNKQGVLPDLGNIGEKKLEVEFNGTGKDLDISNNYVIMVNNFCSSFGGDGTVSAIKDWAKNL